MAIEWTKTAPKPADPLETLVAEALAQRERERLEAAEAEAQRQKEDSERFMLSVERVFSPKLLMLLPNMEAPPSTSGPYIRFMYKGQRYTLTAGAQRAWYLSRHVPEGCQALYDTLYPYRDSPEHNLRTFFTTLADLADQPDPEPRKAEAEAEPLTILERLTWLSIPHPVTHLGIFSPQRSPWPSLVSQSRRSSPACWRCLRSRAGCARSFESRSRKPARTDASQAASRAPAAPRHPQERKPQAMPNTTTSPLAAETAITLAPSQNHPFAATLAALLGHDTVASLDHLRYFDAELPTLGLATFARGGRPYQIRVFQFGIVLTREDQPIAGEARPLPYALFYGQGETRAPGAWFVDALGQLARAAT